MFVLKQSWLHAGGCGHEVVPIHAGHEEAAGGAAVRLHGSQAGGVCPRVWAGPHRNGGCDREQARMYGAPAPCLHLDMGLQKPTQLSVLLVKQGSDAPVVGFCFSFPVDQTTVNSGRIIVWTKGGPMCPA